MLSVLRESVLQANLELSRRNLVKYTWGNVSARDGETGLVVIKPSGLGYDAMKPEDMVVCDLSGKVVEGRWNPSSDTPTHLILYKTFPEIGGIAHTHSPDATAWAQAGRDIPLYGTTHADHFFGPVPCARRLTDEEIAGDYELNTGLVMIETINRRNLNVLHVPAMLCFSHGAFAWGKTAAQAVMNAGVLEEVAGMALKTQLINPEVKPAADAIRDKHFYRKHGEHAYYGQKKET